MREIRETANYVGLSVATWSPGDGATRYKFFTEPSDYNSGDGIGRALGKAEALTFLRGYRAGREATLDQLVYANVANEHKPERLRR